MTIQTNANKCDACFTFLLQSAVALVPRNRCHFGRVGACSIDGTLHGQRSPVHYVGIDHRCIDVAVPQELLHGTNVVAVFEEVGGKGGADGLPQGALVDVVPSGLTAARIGR